mgnify:FL=1
MGASNSSTIKNGDWEHHICWIDQPANPKSESSQSKTTSEVTNNNFIRNASLTRSIKNYREKWKKLEPQKSMEETSQGIELASLASSVKTTDTEEYLV